jgi:lipopolysaccharide transport system ATP-binding protein
MYYGLLDLAAGTAGKPPREGLRRSEFWAVRDVEFSLRRGECLGLIGRNGAGKTTLLRMLNGLIRPDAGSITMRGSVGALIALGAGVSDILTGRENIYCLAALRGLSRRETDHRLEEIIEFAEVQDAIDAPMGSYSSGMRVRLNFAVATALQPDILFLDEVLAVGDAAFREKCYHRISEMRKNAAVIFVSHNMEQVARISSRVLVMDKGQPAFLGDVSEAIDVYERLNKSSVQSTSDAGFTSLHAPVERFDARLVADAISTGDSIDLDAVIGCSQSMEAVQVKLVLYNRQGGFAADGVAGHGDGGIALEAGSNRLRLHVPTATLRNGSYALSVHVIDRDGDIVVWWHKNANLHVTGAYPGGVSDLSLPLVARRDGA